MCSLVVKPSQKNADHNQYEVTIPKFWSRQGDWTPGCSISTNIKIGQHACQLQVFPAGREGVLQDQIEGGDVLSVSSEVDKKSVEIDLIVDGVKSEVKENHESCDPEAGQVVGLSIDLVNLSDSDLVIDGDWLIGLASLNLKCEQLPRAGRIQILGFGREKNELLEHIQYSSSGDDLEIIIDFAELKVQPKFGIDQGDGDESSSECKKSDISEVDLKVSRIGPMLAELRDQFQAEMESMQDILLETPLSAEVSDLKRDVSQMKAELTALMKVELNAQQQALQESLTEEVSKEVTTTLKRELAAQQDAINQAQARDTLGLLTCLKQDIINSVVSLKDSLAGSSSTRSSLSAISEIQLQLEMLQDSVLTAVSSPPTVAMPSYPECPYCMEELVPPAKILQCLSGHLICETCHAKPAISDCPSCHQQFCGRNRGLETFLQKFKDG